VVYLGGYDKNLHAFDADTGASLWTAKTGGDVISSPVVADGVVYVGSDDNNLYAYALDAGDNAAYHRNPAPPSYATLHPDYRLNQK